MNYNKYTKAQLIERLNELETKTIEYKIENFVLEAQLLFDDMTKVVRFVFAKGFALRRSYQGSELPTYLNELRTSLTSIYKERVESISQGSENEVVLLSRKT